MMSQWQSDVIQKVNFFSYLAKTYFLRVNYLPSEHSLKYMPKQFSMPLLTKANIWLVAPWQLKKL